MLRDKQYSNAIPKHVRDLAKQYQRKAVENFKINQNKIDDHIAKKAIAKEKATEIDLSVMTKQQSKELENGPRIPTKTEVETFFEGKIGQKTKFQEFSLIVKNVFPRVNGVSVEFLCPTSQLQLLVFSLRERELQQLKPFSNIRIDDIEFEIFGEVQLGVSERFKVLFSC
jgi:hypothetical protein